MKKFLDLTNVHDKLEMLLIGFSAVVTKSWQLVAVFLQIHFSISNTILFENIQDHSKKIGLFLKVSMSSITWPKPKNDISTISRF